MRMLPLLLALILLALPAASAHAAPAPTTGPNARYALANGCYELRSKSLNRVVTGPLRMQATDLGRYLFYGRAADFLAADAQGQVKPAAAPSDSADWRVDVSGGAFRVTLPSAGGKALSVTGDGALVLGGSGDAALFSFDSATGCATYPEVEVNATGRPGTGSTSYTETSGLLDAHMHLTAYEFLGGRAHCGRPWHRFGAPFALMDCPDHFPNGAGAFLENGVSGPGAKKPLHDPVGWPTFKDWPNHDSLTHEQSYYKWLERSWRAGQRVFVNLMAEVELLCNVYPYKQNSCDEMDSVRLQVRRTRELQDYIDAQHGGPGKGWFRIVTDPFEARRVVNAGKLAVVMGIEVMKPFGCGVYNEEPQCTAEDIDRGLDEVHRLGIRSMELAVKFDNALAGVAGDEGTTGVLVNNGNKLETGKYWQMQTCMGPPDEADKEQPTPVPHNHDSLIANGFATLLPLGAAPVYPPGPQCNARGLTRLGEHALRGLMARGMIFDPDHMSVLARKQAMSVLESERYPGVISSHSWSTPDAARRILRLGGVVTPFAQSAPKTRSSSGFVSAWRTVRAMRTPGRLFGIGWGADQNGLGPQGGPRNGPNPVRYPFKSFDGKVTLDRQRSGQRVFDVNKDGVAHYGLYPDWVEDLRNIAGEQIIRDLSRGPEAYLQMWERAEGVPAETCRSARGRFTRRGMGRQRLAVGPEALLRRAGQPALRRGRVFRYCVQGRGNRRSKARFAAVFTPAGRVGMLVSNARGHGTIWRRRGRGRLRISRGASVRTLRGRARRVSSRLYVRRARGGVRFVYGVRRGRVRYVAVASRSVGRSTRRLRAYLRLSGVR
jgi:microsomal dipeptidase-like Zn-dependent dipeptidase